MQRIFLVWLTVVLGSGWTLPMPVWAGTPPELGHVAWLRDFDAATRKAEETGRPLLILFDEVPGCQTCVRYGQGPLSQPLVKEAAETLFVPVAVYNNVGGPDREVLRRFHEPAWNNPVVRFVDGRLQPLGQRIAGDYSVYGLVSGMVQALTQAGVPIPDYLELLVAEARADRTGAETAVFAMACFWSGEACLGELQGVLETHPGFAQGQEVVEVAYDPSRISFDHLVQAARTAGCAERAGSGREMPVKRSDSDDKYTLRKSAYASAPMTALQATQANARLSRGQSPDALLSPRQRNFAKAAERMEPRHRPILFAERDLQKAFQRAEALLGTVDGS